MKQRTLKHRSFTLAASSVVALPPNPRRTAIIFSPENSAAVPYFIAFGEPAVLGFGILMTGTLPLIVTKELIGDQIMQQVNAIAGGAGTVACLEVSEE